ncbi:MAG: hypothetical protein ACK4SI_09660 [Brevundimonas aurantiaca]|uniref:hypothetical protein n=1 Tax=Brevundimonas aurantiaca TaxID=74316 RepID=UPI00391BBB3E
MRLEERRLQNIRPLRGLGRVSRELGIRLTLFGGVASRAAIQLERKRYKPLDLFDLVPFSADIDLEYDAGPEHGPAVLAAIREHVPFASWFRWSLVDRDRAAKAAAQRRISTVVPLRTIRFSTDASPEISHSAIDDLRTGRVSVFRNPDFHRRSHGDQRDVELFGLMMALNTEADVRSLVPKAPGLDIPAALAWLYSDGLTDLSIILDDERLLGRFWTLFASRRALGGKGGLVFDELTRMAGQIGLFERLGYDPEDPCAPIGLSKLSRAGQFRARELTPSVLTGDAARSSFIGVMHDIMGSMGDYTRIDAPEDLIDPSLTLLAVAPFISIEDLPKTFDPGAQDGFESGFDDEFIQIAWPHKGETIGKSGLTGQLFAYGQRRTAGSYSSVPAVGGVRGAYAWIRIRLDDLTDPDEEKTSQSAALVILRARDA